MTEPVRLSKYLAAQLGCSRREAEIYIDGGWVLVNGVVVEESHFRVTDEKVELHPEASLEPVPPVTLLLNKPAGYSAGNEDNPALQLLGPATQWAEDHSRIRLLRQHFTRLSPTLMLETEATGLVVFTQDWRTLRKLTEDAYLLEQEYIVFTEGTLPPEKLALLNHGLAYMGRKLAPAKVSWQSENRLRFALKAPQPGQIRHMCESVGLTVKEIRRIRIGRQPMAALPSGQWRYMPGYERF